MGSNRVSGPPMGPQQWDIEPGLSQLHVHGDTRGKHVDVAFIEDVHRHNKEGLVAALFFAALEDQAALRDRYLQEANTAREGIVALVYSYVEWVDAQPDWARFVFQSRFAVSNGPLKDELVSRNKQRNKQLKDWMSAEGRQEYFGHLPAELIPSLIIGAAENYSRAWLSGKVKKSPQAYREPLAEAAWNSILQGRH